MAKIRNYLFTQEVHNLDRRAHKHYRNFTISENLRRRKIQGHRHVQSAQSSGKALEAKRKKEKDIIPIQRHAHHKES